MRAIDALDTPLRRGELARALGYWATRYREGQSASPLPSPRTYGWRWCGPRRTAPAATWPGPAGNDLFSEMRLALAAERSRANAPALASGKQVPAVDLHQRDMLRLATIDGARVWHLEDEIGTLTPGKQADIAVIDMRSPHLDGFGDPVAVMVLGAGPADVETVIVGGDVVKRDGKLVGDHVGHALELMHAARERLRA